MRQFELLFVFFILFLFGCSEKSTQKTIKSNDTDSTATIINIELQYTDTLHNPFITYAETTDLKKANDADSPELRFEKIIGQFQKIELPVAFGPNPTPNYQSSTKINDSLFVVNCMEDKFMYQNYPDVMSSYVKGKIIDKTPNYILVVFLHLYDMGFDYQIYSFTHKGKLISKADIGGEGPDWYEDYGVIDNKKNFRVMHKEFDLKQSKADMILKSTKITKYTITANGQFVVEK